MTLNTTQLRELLGNWEFAINGSDTIEMMVRENIIALLKDAEVKLIGNCVCVFAHDTSLFEVPLADLVEQTDPEFWDDESELERLQQAVSNTESSGG